MKKVVLDAGHGGVDGGGSAFEMKESTIVLKLSKIIEAKLSQYDVSVYQTRTSEEKVSLKERTDLSNSIGADIFVSLHTNAWMEESANGIEIIYFTKSQKGKKLATDVGMRLFPTANLRLRHNTGYVERNNLAVIRDTKCPAILIELGFITNKSDSSKLKDDKWLSDCADAIVDGIVKNLDLKLKQVKVEEWEILLAQKSSSANVWAPRIKEIISKQEKSIDKFLGDLLVLMAKE